MARYTREAGVRTLERRIAAVSRAVAVKVAESRIKPDSEKPVTTSGLEKKTLVEDVSHNTHNVSELAHPPEMPIVIDEAALEDILGVSASCHTDLFIVLMKY